MKRITVTSFTAIVLLCVAACGPEKTSDTPRPADAPCDRCGPRPTLTPTYDMAPGS